MLYEQCKRYIASQTKQPERSVFIDYPPTDGAPDLGKRFKEGISQFDDNDIVAIIEDDDYYPPGYLEFVAKVFRGDILGTPYTTYYHLPTRKYKTFHHPNRSSFFCTTLRAGAAKKAVNTLRIGDKAIHIDVALWRVMSNQVLIDIPCRPIGMKHGVGLCGGLGHLATNKSGWAHDEFLLFLKNNVKEDISFYSRYV